MDNILCYSEHELKAFLTGELGENEANDLYQHLESCNSCLSRIEKLDQDLASNGSDLAKSQPKADNSSAKALEDLSEEKIQAMVDRASNRHDTKGLYS